MTEPNATPPAVNSWDALLDILRRRYPGQKDSVLFCIHKLQQNPELTLRDFRAEADLLGIPMAGRALHSARGLLGLLPAAETPAPVAETPVAATPAGPRRRRTRTPEATDDGGASIEHQVVAAVRQIQSAASAESEQLRAAVRQAIALLQRALGD